MDVFNARISQSSILVDEDRLSVSLDFEAPGLCGSFGYSNFAIDSEAIGRYISAILKLVGESRWEKLAGQYIRVRLKDSKVYAIGHILHDNWFDNDVFFGRTHIKN
ncbi:MAG: hypothetical protein K2W95_10210 [Candidatus Obscuribacterales bacterium]|nr:hypothetical protein [Candidatus Obscuribacterales bacterium]